MATVSAQRVLVCCTCGAVLAEGPLCNPSERYPVLYLGAVERALQEHQVATGHGTARNEDRVIWQPSTDDTIEHRGATVAGSRDI